MKNIIMDMFNTVGLDKYTKEETAFLSEIVDNINRAKSVDLWNDEDLHGEREYGDPLHFELYFNIDEYEYGITAEMYPKNGGYEYGVIYCRDKEDSDGNHFCLHLLNWNCWESRKYQQIIEKQDMKAIAQWLFLSLKALGEVRANNMQACLTLFNN